MESKIQNDSFTVLYVIHTFVDVNNVFRNLFSSKLLILTRTIGLLWQEYLSAREDQESIW